MGNVNCCDGRDAPARPDANLLVDPPRARAVPGNGGPAGQGGRASPVDQAQNARAVNDIFGGAALADPLPPAAPENPRLALAQAAIDHVAGISTVGAFHADELYESYDRDAQGKIINAVESDIGKTMKARLEAYRQVADGNHDTQVNALAEQGTPLSEAQNKAQLAKHVLAMVHATAAQHAPDEMPTNCYEKAITAFEFNALRDNNPQLDVVGIERSLPRTATRPGTDIQVFLPRGPDHTILLMGRDPNTDVTDPTTWNNDAVVCDASLRMTYEVADFQERFANAITGAAGVPLRFDPVISLPAATPYNPDPNVLHPIADDDGSDASPVMVELGQAQIYDNADILPTEEDEEDMFF